MIGPGDAPRDCVVLGCGRSGTSLLAGLLHDAGYHLGDTLLRSNEDNPTGYFESRPVNLLNEDLLRPATGDLLRTTDGRPLAARPFADGERWLAALPPDTLLPDPDDRAVHGAMRACLAAPEGMPVCRKDPRFTWTLPLWPMQHALRIVVFREPLAAARSILAMTSQGDLGLTLEGALAIWAANGRRALARADLFPQRWTFVSYASVLDGSALPRLARQLGISALPRDRVDPRLRRNPADGDLGEEAAEVYELLRGRTPESGEPAAA